MRQDGGGQSTVHAGTVDIVPGFFPAIVLLRRSVRQKSRKRQMPLANPAIPHSGMTQKGCQGQLSGSTLAGLLLKSVILEEG
jgi:hypothetical protein